MKIKRAVQTSHVDQLVREGVEEFANLRLKTNIGVNLFIFGISFYIYGNLESGGNYNVQECHNPVVSKAWIINFTDFSFMKSQGCLKLQLTMDCQGAEQMI